jgi:hypothetical protein
MSGNIYAPLLLAPIPALAERTTLYPYLFWVSGFGFQALGLLCRSFDQTLNPDNSSPTLHATRDTLSSPAHRSPS